MTFGTSNVVSSPWLAILRSALERKRLVINDCAYYWALSLKKSAVGACLGGSCFFISSLFLKS